MHRRIDANAVQHGHGHGNRGPEERLRQLAHVRIPSFSSMVYQIRFWLDRNQSFFYPFCDRLIRSEVIPLLMTQLVLH